MLEQSSVRQGADEIYTEKIFAGRRTYYLDIKVTSKDDKYLVISEKRRSNDSSKVEHDRVMVFKEDFHKFFRSMAAIKNWLAENGELVDEVEPDAVSFD